MEEEDYGAKRAAALLLLRRRRKRQAQYWIHPLNVSRVECGEFHRLCQELEQYPERYFQYFRMNSSQFEKLHAMLEDEIRKEDTNYRTAITTRERLAVTIRFLATGNSFRSLAYSFRIGATTIKEIVEETCFAIQRIVMPLYIPQVTKEKWKEIQLDFLRKWNFPNCVGAVDGKHVQLFAPKHSGSKFFNYKGSFSLVLMAVVDANYKYIMIDVGAYGGNSDGGVFANSPFGRLWLANDPNLELPEKQPLPSADIPLPIVLVADEAFPLKDNILRPYPGKNLSDRERIFNYRLSRARRVVENAFGITAHTWRILLKRIEVNVEFATVITVACCTLQNYLLTENIHDNDSLNPSQQLSSDATQNNINAINHQRKPHTRPTKHSMDIRNTFADWFTSPTGEVPWQYDAIKH